MSERRRGHASLVGIVCLAASFAAASDDPDARIGALRAFEAKARAASPRSSPPSSETGLGADPWTLRETQRVGVFAGILRGRAALVLLDRDLRERARAPAPRSTTGLAIAPNGELYASGELSPEIARYRVAGDALVALGSIRVDGAFGVRDVAVTPGALHALDADGGRIVTVRGGRQSATAACRGASELRALDRALIVDCPLQHRIAIVPLGDDDVPDAAHQVEIVQDGPMWGFDARSTPEGVLIATGGIENRPLDRKGGFFGNVDSFVTVYRVARGRADELASIDVGDFGVVTPKALVIEPGTPTTIGVTSYGSPVALRVTLRDAGWTAATRPSMPGVRQIVRVADGTWFGADPLLDRWVRFDESSADAVPIAGEPEKTGSDVDVGEALFFTTLMAPWNTNEGKKSRFSCEACHFEGKVDGRTHHTGREDIRVVTKPLLGLAGNAPHFTRALDPDLSSVAMNEFRVAGAGNAYDPWFSIDVDAFSWLRDLGVRDARLEPERLRRAFVAFALAFSHRPNPRTVGRARFTDLERRGADVFASTCERCHASRLVANDPASRVAREEWEAMIFSDAAPIVWARDGYEKTGVVPYVHPDGARPSSLRRLHVKAPYLTSGAARELEDVLASARIEGGAFFHATAGQGAGRPIDPADASALLAFLRLL